MDFSLIIPAFIAGILTFLAPCTLPLVPAYLGFISGVSAEEIQDPKKTKAVRMKIFRNGFFFIAGFSGVFVLLGAAAGFLGHTLFQQRIWLSRVGGVFVILFGLFMLDVLKLPFLSRNMQFKIPAFFQRGKVTNSFVLGAAFGLGWTPCVGPILGSILTLAASSATVGEGAVLLAVFSLGLAIPFLIIAASIGSASTYLAKASRYLHIVSIVGGVFLIFLGILLLTNSFGAWIAYFYRLFDFINYDKLLDYL